MSEHFKILRTIAEGLKSVEEGLKKITERGLLYGEVRAYGGSSAPNGWLPCDGRAVSRTTYSDLFRAIGTTWGAGDGSTTFNLPDLRGRALIGAGTGTGLSSRALGTSNIGAESVTLTFEQTPVKAHTHGMAHTHSHSHMSAAFQNRKVAGGTSYRAYLGATYTPRDGQIDSDVDATASSKSVTDPGGDGAVTGHPNMQPSAVVNYIIYAGGTR